MEGLGDLTTYCSHLTHQAQAAARTLATISRGVKKRVWPAPCTVKRTSGSCWPLLAMKRSGNCDHSAAGAIGVGRQILAFEQPGHGRLAARLDPQREKCVAWGVAFPGAVIDLDVGQLTAPADRDRASADTAKGERYLLQ